MYEALACFWLFLSFPIPGMLFPNTTALQYAAHAATIIMNDYFFAGLLR